MSIAKMAGEALRIKRTANQEKNLDPQTRQWIENLKQNAENGNIDAMFELGAYYIKGMYVGYDPHLACYWWTEAANRGHVGSMYNLGALYFGSVSEMFYDDNKSAYWFNEAANKGHNEAYKVLKQHFRYSSFRNKWVRKL